MPAGNVAARKPSGIGARFLLLQIVMIVVGNSFYISTHSTERSFLAALAIDEVQLCMETFELPVAVSRRYEFRHRT